MTVLVGILCQDGVVIGSDSSMTFSANQHFRTIEQPAQKTFIVQPDVLFAGTGSAGLGQRFAAILGGVRSSIRQQVQDAHVGSISHIEIAKSICLHTLKDFEATCIRPGGYGALVAFPGGGGLQLCEFAIDDFQPEFKMPTNWFVSMGSGQPIVDPFLGLLCRTLLRGEQPRLREGIFAAQWAMEHAISLNTGGINGPAQIGVLARDNASDKFVARLLLDEELAEHVDGVQAAENYLAAYR